MVRVHSPSHALQPATDHHLPLPRGVSSPLQHFDFLPLPAGKGEGGIMAQGLLASLSRLPAFPTGRAGMEREPVQEVEGIWEEMQLCL